MPLFSVTYDIVTQKSAKLGDVAERGYIAKDMSLRDALEAVTQTRTSHVGGVEAVEADSSPIDHPRWITIINGPEFETGAVESRSLHIPEAVSRTSARRIARMLGVRELQLRSSAQP